MDRHGAASNVDTLKRAVRERVRRYVQNGVRGHSLSDCACLAIQRRHGRQVDKRTGRAYRQRARADQFAGVRIVSVLGLALLGQWWNPVAWWNDFFGAVATTWNDVKAFIHDAIKAAVDLLDDGVNLFYYVFVVVTDALQAGLNAVTNIATVAWQWVESAATVVGGWIQYATTTLWNDVIWPAIKFVEDGLNFAVGALQYAIDGVINAAAALWDNYVSPLWDWVAHSLETVSGWIWSAIDGFYNAFIKPIIATVEQIGHDLYAALDWLFNVAVGVVDAVIKAWDWVVWFGEHTFADIRALLSGTDAQLNRDWLLGAAHAGGGVADEVAKWLEDLTA